MKIADRSSRNKTLSAVIVISIGLHLIGLLAFGMVKIAESVFREEKVFEAPPILETPEVEPDYTAELMERNQESSPPPPNPIVVSDLQDIELPALDIDISIDNTSSYGRGSGGFGTGVGGGQIREMAVNLTDFGYSDYVEGTLEGILFDFKRNKKGESLGRAKYNDIRSRVYEFASGSNWSTSELRRKYFTADKKLYGSHWVIAKTPAEAAPRAFEAEDQIAPIGVIALYDGNYVPTKGGAIRFCGLGDDVLMVRLDEKIVLDASWTQGYSNMDFSKQETGEVLLGHVEPIRYGEWIELEAGKTYDLKILLGEGPGGLFGAYLFYQTKGGDMRVFSTNPLTAEERKRVRDIHRDVANLL
ncbi:MAG: hypothetical protein AAF065_08675 [Verrucomicrobiota bacterium]